MTLRAGMMLIAAGMTSGLINTASAQSVVSTKQLTIEVADGMAMAAIEQCRKDGFRVSVAIVDRSGNVQALLKDNGAGPHTPDTARRKAYTSASFGVSSAEFAKRVSNPGAATLKDISEVIALAGALPIRSGNDLLGGIGVGGAPAGEKYEVCANAALQKRQAEVAAIRRGLAYLGGRSSFEEVGGFMSSNCGECCGEMLKSLPCIGTGAAPRGSPVQIVGASRRP